MMRFFIINRVVILTVLIVLSFTSCSKEEVETVDDLAIDYLPKEVLSKANELDINPKSLKYDELKISNQLIEKMVSYGDIYIQKDDFLNIPAKNGVVNKQYRATHIVDTKIYKTVNILAYTGSTLQNFIGLSAKAQQGVRDAVENWNNAGSKIKFNLTFGTNLFDFLAPNSTYHTLVHVESTNVGLGGSGGFPSTGGKPGTVVRISPELNTNTTVSRDYFEHVFTHELGHVIGFEHTDFNKNNSCKALGRDDLINPAMHILGSLPAWLDDTNSVMNGCGPLTSTGELSGWDTAAVRILYP